MDIFKNIHDSLHPNLKTMNQVPYLMGNHLTFDQTSINEHVTHQLFLTMQ
jgi:hypothetical protein